MSEGSSALVCVLQLVETGKGWGRGHLTLILLLAASEMPQAVRYSLQLSGSPVKGTSGKNVLFFPAVTPRAGSRLSFELFPRPSSPCCL